MGRCPPAILFSLFCFREINIPTPLALFWGARLKNRQELGNGGRCRSCCKKSQDFFLEKKDKKDFLGGKFITSPELPYANKGKREFVLGHAAAEQQKAHYLFSPHTHTQQPPTKSDKEKKGAKIQKKGIQRMMMRHKEPLFGGGSTRSSFGFWELLGGGGISLPLSLSLRSKSALKIIRHATTLGLPGKKGGGGGEVNFPCVSNVFRERGREKGRIHFIATK